MVIAGTTGDIWELNVIGFVAAVVTSVVVLSVAESRAGGELTR